MPDGNINPVWIHLLVVFHFCVNYLLSRIPWIQDVEFQGFQLNAYDSRLVCCTYLCSCLAGLWPERWPCLTWTWTGNLWDQQNVIFFSQWPGWHYSCGSVWLNVSVFVYAYSNCSSSEIHFVWSNCETGGSYSYSAYSGLLVWCYTLFSKHFSLHFHWRRRRRQK